MYLVLEKVKGRLYHFIFRASEHRQNLIVRLIRALVSCGKVKVKSLSLQIFYFIFFYRITKVLNDPIGSNTLMTLKS